MQGNVTFSCSEPQLVATTFLSSSSSFLALRAEATAGLSVRLQFRTWSRDGLLLSVQLNPDPEHLLLSVQLNPDPEHLVLQLSAGQLHLTHPRSALQRSESSTGGVRDLCWNRSISFGINHHKLTTGLGREGRLSTQRL
ncbi:hypothetical protein AAFF_G00057290 [Aldrovandia affinis]|uniref:Uncharacterized protein n=1 Tax=Aldrovandia affinis TaxID=143900 RepID=A0AAD7S0Q3_9TELE|nr:hypothetical protein AAFF_G00057290 [Aldrovandia affinis]